MDRRVKGTIFELIILELGYIYLHLASRLQIHKAVKRLALSLYRLKGGEDDPEELSL